MDASLTVGELKKIIADLPDDLPIYIWPQSFKEDCSYVDKAYFCPKSSISNDHLSITAGEKFSW